MEGIITIGFGVLSFFMVHDFPDTATFLSEQDRARVIRRLKTDKQSSAEHEEFKMAYLWAAITDWKMYMGMIIYMGCDMPLYAFSLFLPTIIKNLGNGKYSATHSQLLTVPPYACAAVLTITVGYLADRTKARGLFNIGISMIGVVGFGMLLGSADAHVQYAGCFLGALGIYPCIANTIAWTSNNIEGVYKRGIVLGFVIGWGNINGVVSSNIYFKAPRYKVGHGVVMAYMLLFLFGGSILQTILLRIENKARREGKRDYLVEGLTIKEAEKLGDKRPDFIYTV